MPNDRRGAHRPDDLAQLTEELTVWASPGLVVDEAHPELGALAALTVVPSITVHTSDKHAGAELVDVVLSSLLEQGFALVTSFDGPGLAGLPLLADCRPNSTKVVSCSSCSSPVMQSTTETWAPPCLRAGMQRFSAVDS